MGIYMETERLILRDHVERDLEAYHELVSDGEAMHYLPDLRTQTLEESRESLMEAVKEETRVPREKYFLGIFEKGTGEYVGDIGYTVEQWEPERTVGLGYFTRKSFWGKGYMTEAVKRLLRFAFEEDGVEIVNTGCLKENRGSEKVMIKCGMRKNEELPGGQVHEGRKKDRVTYCMTKADYRDFGGM